MVSLELQMMVTALRTRSLPINTTPKEQIEPVYTIVHWSVLLYRYTAILTLPNTSCVSG